MIKTIQKVLLLMLLAIYLLGCSSSNEVVQPLSEDGYQTVDGYRDIKWKRSEGDLIITGSGSFYREWTETFPWEQNNASFACLGVKGDFSSIGDDVFKRLNVQHIQVTSPCEQLGISAFQFAKATCIDLSNTDLTYIGMYAFANSNLTELHLPATVETIDQHVFSECQLSVLYWYGTREEFDAVEILSGNDPLNDVEIVYVKEQMVFSSESGNAYWRIHDDVLELIADGSYVAGAGSMGYAWRYMKEVDETVRIIKVRGSCTYMSPYCFAQRNVERIEVSTPTFIEFGMGFASYVTADVIDLSKTSLKEIPLDGFFGASINTLYLPKTITRVAPCAFDEATIDTIVYYGSEEELNGIVIEGGNEGFYAAKVICMGE